MALDEKRSNTTDDNITVRNENSEEEFDEGNKLQRQEIANTAQRQRITKKSIRMLDPDYKRWHINLERRSKNTANVRDRRVGKVSEELGIKPKKWIEIGLKDPKLVADMLQDRITVMEEAGYAPQYIKSTMTAIKSWLSHFDIVITRKLLITDPEATPTLVDERVPEKGELTELFTGANLRAGTIMSFMAKSGVRPQVLGNIDGTDGLMLEDLLDLALVNGKWCFLNQPPEVIVRKSLSKANHEYRTYMTPLQQKWFLAYLNERMANGEALNPQSPVVHPLKQSPYATKQKKGRFMTTQMVSRDVRESMRPTFKWRPYVLRAYFRTQLLIAEANGLISHSIAEWFFGHKGDMSARYSTNKGVLPKQLVETMKQSFLRCEEYLDIEKEKVVIKETNSESSDMSESSSILYGDKIQKVQEISELSQQTNQNNISTKDGSS